MEHDTQTVRLRVTEYVYIIIHMRPLIVKKLLITFKVLWDILFQDCIRATAIKKKKLKKTKSQTVAKNGTDT